MRIWASVTGGLIRSSRKYLSATFSPLSFFAAGEQGAWYDPSDFSTMFQDSAGTTPVTAVEQPVGRILDKSGRGNHATQATSASRPVLKQDGNGKYYLLFDGIDDGLATPVINFSTTDKMTVWAGVNAPSAATGIFLELSVEAGSNAGSFYLTDNESLSGISTNRLHGTVGAGGGSLAVAPPDKAVYTYSFDTAAASASQTIARVNGAVAADTVNAGTTSPGNFGNYPLFIGRRAGSSVPFNGHLYSLVIRGAASSVAQIASGESYANSKTGAY